MNPLEKTDEAVMVSYGEDKTVVRRKIDKVAKHAPTRSVGVVMGKSRAISN